MGQPPSPGRGFGKNFLKGFQSQESGGLQPTTITNQEDTLSEDKNIFEPVVAYTEVNGKITIPVHQPGWRSEITKAYEEHTTDTAIASLATKYQDLTCATPKDYKATKKAIAEIRNLRVAVEKKRKELKADALEYGRTVDSEAKRITELLTNIEEPLKAKKKEADEEKARIKAEKEKKEREEEEKRLAAVKAEEERLRLEREAFEKEKAEFYKVKVAQLSAEAHQESTDTNSNTSIESVNKTPEKVTPEPEKQQSIPKGWYYFEGKLKTTDNKTYHIVALAKDTDEAMEIGMDTGGIIQDMKQTIPLTKGFLISDSREGK